MIKLRKRVKEQDRTSRNPKERPVIVMFPWVLYFKNAIGALYVGEFQILMSEKIANRLTLNVLHKQSYDRIEKGRTLRTGVE